MADLWFGSGAGVSRADRERSPFLSSTHSTIEEIFGTVCRKACLRLLTRTGAVKYTEKANKVVGEARQILKVLHLDLQWTVALLQAEKLFCR